MEHNQGYDSTPPQDMGFWQQQKHEPNHFFWSAINPTHTIESILIMIIIAS